MRLTKYQPLVDNVAAQTADSVTLSFTEIEALLGFPLPATLRIDPARWTRPGSAVTWRLEAHGWRARLDLRNCCVIFTRDTEERIPKRYNLDENPSRYQPLFDFLAAYEDDEVTLPYKEIAAMLGGLLPESAVLHTAWWTGTKYAHVQTWRAMGWQAHASAANLRVRFTRDAEEG